MPKISLREICEYPLDRGGAYREFCGRGATEALGNLRLCRNHKQAHMLAIAKQIEDDPEMRTWARGALGAAGGVARYKELTRDREAWISQLEQTAKKETPSFVYFVEREGLIKIGITKNVERRLKEIGRGYGMIPGMTLGPVRLMATMPGGRAEEKSLHRRFRAHHVAGEWFRISDEISEFIDTLALAKTA